MIIDDSPLGFLLREAPPGGSVYRKLFFDPIKTSRDEDISLQVAQALHVEDTARVFLEFDDCYDGDFDSINFGHGEVFHTSQGPKKWTWQNVLAYYDVCPVKKAPRCRSHSNLKSLRKAINLFLPDESILVPVALCHLHAHLSEHLECNDLRKALDRPHDLKVTKAWGSGSEMIMAGAVINLIDKWVMDETKRFLHPIPREPAYDPPPLIFWHTETDSNLAGEKLARGLTTLEKLGMPTNMVVYLRSHLDSTLKGPKIVFRCYMTAFQNATVWFDAWIASNRVLDLLLDHKIKRLSVSAEFIHMMLDTD